VEPLFTSLYRDDEHGPMILVVAPVAIGASPGPGVVGYYACGHCETSLGLRLGRAAADARSAPRAGEKAPGGV